MTDKTAQVTARAEDVITNCLIEVAKDRGYVHPFHRQAEYILSALTEAGLCIVAVASIANVIDIAEFGQRRLDAGHYRPIIDACRDMLAAVAPGAEDAR